MERPAGGRPAMIDDLIEILANVALTLFLVIVLFLAVCTIATVHWINEDIGDAPATQIQSTGGP
jgi:hypothetical protein